MTSIVSFAVSLLLMFALIALKRFEVQNDKRFVPKFRNTLDVIAHRLWILFIYTIPRTLAGSLRYVIIHITDLFSSGLLAGVRILEKRLYRFVIAVKGRKELRQNKTTSNYLNDVADHKEEVRENLPEDFHRN